MDTTSKVALVTGATTGIGAAATAARAEGGFTVYGTGRDHRKVTITGVRALEMDVTHEASMHPAVNAVVDAHGAVDVLVNNAGCYLSGFLEDLPMDEVRGQLETNVFGLLRMAQLVPSAMREQGAGRIINVSSIGGIVTSPGAGASHASKFAVEPLSDVLRMEVREFGIDVVVIAPAGVATLLWSKTPATYPGTGPDSPYAQRIERHRRSVTKLFGDDDRFLVLSPEQVGRTILTAATTRRPRTRYPSAIIEPASSRCPPATHARIGSACSTRPIRRPRRTLRAGSAGWSSRT